MCCEHRPRCVERNVVDDCLPVAVFVINGPSFITVNCRKSDIPNLSLAALRFSGSFTPCVCRPQH